MSKLLRFAAAAAALVLVVGAGCKKNSAPEAPTVSGPTSARPGDTLTYHFDATDREGDSVFFMISWRGGDSTPWSPARPSGGEYTQTHSYTDTGTYYVKAKARDGEDAESGWSDSIRVRIGAFPPEAPIRPIGPARCSTGLAYTWTTKASHPLHDSVRIQFSWGDGNIDSFGHMVANNASFDSMHTYSLRGSYKIAARARDAAGFESPWSETLVVTVDSSSIVPRGAPRSLVLSAATDSTVNIVWAVDSTPSRYVVLFKETGALDYDSVDGTLTPNYAHNPAHRTGQYRVAAVYDTHHITSTEAPSTVPYWNSALTVHELSDTAANAGYGWNRKTGEASLYDMTVSDSADRVDFYVTDSAPGFAGPLYKVASPSLAPQDPGGTVPTGSWNFTWFTHLDSLATENSILPRFSQALYRSSSLLDSLPRFVTCCTHDTCYALLRVASVDTINGTAEIESWFQAIKGLRLIEH